MLFVIAGATLFEWLIFIWACFSVPLYFVVVIVIVRNINETPFNSSFFKLCLSEAVADITITFIVYPLLSFRIWGWLDWAPLFNHQSLSWFFRMSYYCVTYFFAFPQIAGIFILCYNRYTNIMYPQRPDWSKTKVLVSILLQWLTGFVAAFPYIFVKNYTVEQINGTFGEHVVLHSRPPKLFYTIFLLCFFLYIYGVVGIIGVLYLKMFRKVHQHNAQLSHSQPHLSVKKDEWRLALAGFVLFALLVLYGLFFAMYAVTIKIGTVLIKHMNSILVYNTGSILSLINPYLLVICSKQLKKKLFEMIRCKKDSVVTIKSSSKSKREA